MIKNCIFILCFLFNLNLSLFCLEEEIPFSSQETFHKLKHLTILPDGNRRWSKLNNVPKIEGHRRCYLVQIPNLTDKLFSEGLNTLTFWYFSVDNWKRSPEELNSLMLLFEESLEMILKIAHKHQARMIHLGRKDRLPKNVLAEIEKVENATKDYKEHTFNIALDHGGRDEVTRAIHKLLQDTTLSTEEKLMDETSFARYLDTGDQPFPNPDFVIRTSGERRLSSLLIWQAAYSEYYFEPHHFPELTWEDLKKAFVDFNKRERRYGR